MEFSGQYKVRAFRFVANRVRLPHGIEEIESEANRKLTLLSCDKADCRYSRIRHLHQKRGKYG